MAETPYAEAVAMFQAGQPADAVAQRLKERGLAADEIELLLKAVRGRGGGAAAPASEWVSETAPSSVPAEAPAAPPAPVADSAPFPCTRCGTFITTATQQLVLKKPYCAACAARPDVNFPKAYRDANWGRRDGWAWFFGVMAVILFLTGTASVIAGQAFLAVIVLAIAGVYASFWSGWKPARLLLIGLSVVNLALTLANGGGMGILAIGFVIAAVRSPRNKLFFEIELTEDELMAAWKAEHDNRLALWARGAAIVALLTPMAWIGLWRFAFVTAGFGLLGVVLGGVGLTRVNPSANPPIGQRGPALFGVIGGAIALVAAVAYLVVVRIVLR